MIIKLNEHNLVHEIAALGVHHAIVGIFASKSRIIPLKITAVRTPAANILKQEMFLKSLMQSLFHHQTLQVNFI